jgi:processive 1,2-diacylglycerol beta-glucosyltransferase
MFKILALQRESHVAYGVPSLSVSARITEVLDYLHDQGKVTFISVSESDPAVLNAVKWCDTLIMSKHNSKLALNITIHARKLRKKIIYDIDDWIFSFPDYSGASDQKEKIEFAKDIIELANHVTVANEVLKKAVEKKWKAVTLLQNGMYIEKYRHPEFLDFIEPPPPKIVFANADSFKLHSRKEQLLAALQEFFITHPKYILDYYGDPIPELFMLPFMHFTKRVPYNEFIRMLLAGGYQFAISPLGAEEDAASLFFNRCKNPFKYLNYGTTGIPGIYSSTPIYTEVVKQDITGLLVHNTFEDWLETLHRLSDDEALRGTIRKAAHDDIKNNHHISKPASVLLGLLRT